MRNKQLKYEYKQRKFRIGIFQLRNVVNGKILIGSSVNLDAIWNRIQSELRFNGHRNETLQKDWNQFGQQNFNYEVLLEIDEAEQGDMDNANELKKLELMFIEDLQPFGVKGYHQKKDC